MLKQQPMKMIASGLWYIMVIGVAFCTFVGNAQSVPVGVGQCPHGSDGDGTQQWTQSQQAPARIVE